MASNFKILFHRNGENLHFKLTGNFDGSAALDLNDALKENRDNTKNIIIHTSGLASIDHFGLYMFQKYFGIYDLSRDITFTGEYGHLMAPSGSDVF
jgi:anti-anti-sigma regulatory factor